MFIQTGDNFDDVSLVSGADTRVDCRGFVLFDYDRDGWLDLGVTSPQSPRFQIYRNQIAKRDSESPNQSVLIALEGGNQGTRGQSEWSSRDAYGATVLVTTNGTKRKFQLSCGEGLASQNSKWIHVGLGEAKQVDRLEVTWPSGKTTSHDEVSAGTRIKLFEDGRSSVLN